jgi:putative FmdB family regulatory protein
VPTYQYACTECGHAFDEVQSFSDDALTVCPVCGGKLRKMFNAVGVVFKGSGFYRNDSRSPANGSAPAAASEGGSSDGGSSEGGATKTETKGDSKTDAKPATKSDAKPAASKSSSSNGSSSS